MLQILSFITNCPEISSNQSIYAEYINKTHISVFYPFTTDNIQLSEFSNFTDSVQLKSTADNAGNCFQLNSKIMLDSCNIITFQFEQQLQPFTVGNKIIKEIFYKINNEIFTYEIIQEIKFTVNLNHGKELNRLEIQLGKNVCDIQTNLQSSERGCEFDEVCGINQVAKVQFYGNQNLAENISYKQYNCSTGKFVNRKIQLVVEENILFKKQNIFQIKINENGLYIETILPSTCNGKVNKISQNITLINSTCKDLIIQNNSYQINEIENKYVNYTYFPHHQKLPVRMNSGEMCKFIGQEIFEQGKYEYENEGEIVDPDEEDDDVIITPPEEEIDPEEDKEDENNADSDIMLSLISLPIIALALTLI